jgi:hypothetical protein
MRLPIHLWIKKCGLISNSKKLMIMKTQLYRLLVIMLITLVGVSCEEFEDPNLDFSNNQPQYVELSSGSAIQASAGEAISITVRVRENINTDVNVDYEITGDISSNGTVTISEGNLTSAISVSVPMDISTGSAEVKLTGVDNGLQLGRGGASTGLSAISRQIVW